MDNFLLVEEDLKDFLESLHWNLDNTKVPKKSNKTDAFRHLKSCLNANTSSIFVIKVSINISTPVKEN